MREAKEQVVRACPGKYEEIEYELAYFKALKFCLDWNPHRKWLLENGVSLVGFAEENQFQIHQKKFKFTSSQ